MAVAPVRINQKPDNHHQQQQSRNVPECYHQRHWFVPSCAAVSVMLHLICPLTDPLTRSIPTHTAPSHLLAIILGRHDCDDCATLQHDALSTVQPDEPCADLSSASDGRAVQCSVCFVWCDWCHSLDVAFDRVGGDVDLYHRSPMMIHCCTSSGFARTV